MDIGIARTFLEVVKTGSFVRAAENLNLTQTAVSARIRVLEDQLDRPVFIRNKAGARLTPAGEQFQRFATTLVQFWARAQRAVALPPARNSVYGAPCSGTGCCGCGASVRRLLSARRSTLRNA